MAATNYTPIQLYFSTTASAVPLAANLAQGELAINITDGKLYYEDNAGVVQVIATKGAGTIGGSTTQIQYNNAGALAGNAAMTFNSGTSTTTLTTLNLTNALGATYGGTAQSSYTQGDILYSSATNTLSKLGIGTVNYILTSTGSVPQWVAPTSVTVQTANNLAGGLAGSVPYQSALDTTTFLAIGAANRVMTSTGTAPQWVTSLTGLTGVSSSSITNTSLTSGRVVLSTTAGLQADSANLTFNGTTLSATGFSTTGLSTLVQTVTIGNSSFNGTAVFAAATPAKLYIGTGTVTDTTSAIGATNAVGAVSSLAITPIAATNTSVTYTNAATLYIAGAPSAGTNVTLTNPYALYVAAGDAYFGGTVTAGTVNLTTLDLTNLEVTNIKAKDGTASATIADSTGVMTIATLVGTNGATIQGITVGRGAGAVATNTAVGASALASNSTGVRNTALGYQAGYSSTNNYNVFVGYFAGVLNTGSFNTIVGDAALGNGVSGSGSNLVAVGQSALYTNTSGSNNTALGTSALQSNTTASNNTAVGYQAGYSNTTGANVAAFGKQSMYGNTTGNGNSGFGIDTLYTNSTGSFNTAVGGQALLSNTTASSNNAFGYQSLYTNTTGADNTAVGHLSMYLNSTGSRSVAIGRQALYSSTVSDNTGIGYFAGYSISSGQYNLAVGGGDGATGSTLSNNTTGSNNTALGFQALRSNTTASNNTAVGYQALYSNTTASRNTAVGYQAGYSVTTNLYNAYLGYGAGYGNTGDSNVGVGDGALGASGAAAACAAVGQGALGATTGNYNTAVGYNSGVAITTGAKNTILGRYSGNQGGLDIRTASNYIVLSDGDGNPRAYCNSSGNWVTEYGLVTTNLFGNGGTSNTGGAANWWKIGTVERYTDSLACEIVLQGTRAYGGGEPVAGQTVIMLRANNVGNLEGFFYGVSQGRQTVIGVAYLYTGTGTLFDIYVKPAAAFSSIKANVRGEMPFTPQDFNTGSTTQPASSTSLQSVWNLQIDGNNTLTANSFGLGLGDTTPTSGMGLAFPATQVASSNANTLDDYEEGTWTFAVTTTGGSVTMSSSLDTCYYIKIGRLVTVGGQVTVDSVSSPTGAIVVTLPFAGPDLSENAEYPAGSVAIGNSTSKNANDFALLKQDGSEMRIYIADVNLLSSTNANAQQLQAGTIISFQLSYYASA
jgi:hypothetical protein